MEVLDYVGVTTCYKYLYGKEATMATACVDNMRFYNPVDIEKDLIITAYPSYVGSTTIEV